jgi:hypothetical protein
MVRDKVDLLAVELIDRPRTPVAQLHGALGDHVEDRPDIRGRPADDAQDLAGRPLLVQGSREVLIPGLQLLKQPDVLDGDHRLVGKGGD